MLDHIYISVSDVPRSLAFYAATLEPLGWRELGSYDSSTGPDGVPDLFGLADDAYGSGVAVGSSIWLRQRQSGECSKEHENATDRHPILQKVVAARKLLICPHDRRRDRGNKDQKLPQVPEPNFLTAGEGCGYRAGVLVENLLISLRNAWGSSVDKFARTCE